jgi:hypothetical protein
MNRQSLLDFFANLSIDEINNRAISEVFHIHWEEIPILNSDHFIVFVYKVDDSILRIEIYFKSKVPKNLLGKVYTHNINGLSFTQNLINNSKLIEFCDGMVDIHYWYSRITNHVMLPYKSQHKQSLIERLEKYEYATITNIEDYQLVKVNLYGKNIHISHFHKKVIREINVFGVAIWSGFDEQPKSEHLFDALTSVEQEREYKLTQFVEKNENNS